MKNIVKVGIVAVASLWLTACGSNTANNIIKGVSLRTYEHPATHHQYMEVKAEIDSANMIFPTAYLQVVDPKNPNIELGTVHLQSDFNGKNLLVVNADISGFKLGSYIGESKLPNGNPLPVAGLSNVFALNVKDSKTRLYVGEYQDQVVLGVAVAMKEFDGLAASIPNSNLFFAFPQESGVSGIAGFFTGSQSSTSGIALFAKTTFASPLGMQKLSRASATGAPQFRVNTLKSSDMWKAQYFFWDLNRRGGKLHLAK